MKNYSFSLVIPTLNRHTEVEALLSSLKNQTYTNFEVIIVDQNENNLLNDVITKYKESFPKFLYLKSNRKGAAFNRNYGASFAKNDVVTFPDDDSIYRTDLLEKINAFINKYDDFDFYSCNLEFLQSQKCRFKKNISPITVWNASEHAIEFAFFYKKNNISELFDKDFGVGSVWGSNEIVDLIWNNISKGKKGIFNGYISILHPDKSDILDEKRLYNYALGFGASYKKAITEYHQIILLFQFLKYVVRNTIALFLIPQKRIFYIASLKGKLKGFFEYHKKGEK